MLLVEKILREAEEISDIYYHGTSSEAAGESILRSGFIKPPEIKSKAFTTPMKGRVYLTKSLEYAIIYTIGANMLGNTLPDSFIAKDGRYGYLFKVKEFDHSNTLPDEDTIGELIYHKSIDGLNYLAQQVLTRNQFNKVMNGEYIYWAQAGKKINKLIQSGYVQRYLVNQIRQSVDHLAHNGEIEIIEAWKFDKTRSIELKKDGSNFFTLAERIK